MRRLCFGFLAVAVISVWAPSAQAAMQLRLTDNDGNSMTVADADSDGVLTVDSALGNWMINVVTGLSKPALGTEVHPQIHFNSVNLSSQTGGALTIELTDTGFTGRMPACVLDIGGTTNGSLIVRWYGDTNDVAFGTTNPLGVLGPFGAGPFSGTTSSPMIDTTHAYSLTAIAMIEHAGGGRETSSFDTELRCAPEAGSMAIWSLLSVAGLVVGVRRARRRTA